MNNKNYQKTLINGMQFSLIALVITVLASYIILTTDQRAANATIQLRPTSITTYIGEYNGKPFKINQYKQLP